MAHNEDMYGSTFRVFEPLSSGLSVEQGSSKPARVKPNQRTKVMLPIGDMFRGDKSGLNWEKIKKGKAQASNQSGEGEALEVSNDALITQNDAIADMAMDYFDNGDIDEWQYDEVMDELNNLEASDSNIFSTY